MVRSMRAVDAFHHRAADAFRVVLLGAALVPALAGVARAVPALAGVARADANCMARVLSDVPAEEAPEQVKSKQSGMFGPISEIKVEKQSGKMYYCAASSYCYGSNAFQITTPCRFKLDKASSGGKFFLYSAR